VEKVALKDLQTSEDVRKLPNEELLQVHHRLHQLYGAARDRGEATEYPFVNLHVWVVQEMERRGMRHNAHDELDRETERLQKAPAAWVAERLARAADQVLVPAYVSLVGSAVADDDPHDIDVLVRDDAERLSQGQRESLYLLARKLLDPDKQGKKLHMLFNAQGPHLASGQAYIPLCDLVLRPRKEAELVAKAALEPITRYNPSKPAMVGYTEFFSADELWDKWASKQNVLLYVSPKVDGFRCILQKAGNKVSIYLEDAKEERSDQLPALRDALKDAPDCVIEGELQAARDGKFLARPQVLSVLAGKLEAEPYVFLYDVLYVAPEGDVHGQPFAKRYPLLQKLSERLGERFVVLPQLEAEGETAFKQACRKAVAWQPWEDAGLAIEGVVARRSDMPYTFGPTDDYAKFKLWVELKVKVVAVERVQNGYVYECALRDDETGQDVVLGRTFVSAEKLADKGDTLNVMVEELLLYPDGRVAWGKPTPMGPDRSRPAYTVKQAIDIARRGKVLKEVAAAEARKSVSEEGEGGETRGEAALRNWEENWHEAMPLSGKALPFILHAHFRGLSEEEAKLGLEDLLKTDHSLHFDLRLGTDRFSGWWGITLFAGTTAENREELRVFRMMRDPTEKIQSAPKQFGPLSWMKVGLDKPLVVEPGGVGSTSRGYSKFFAVDHGTWRLGFARQHAVEIWLDGQKLKGRFLWQYAPTGEGRIWLFTRPEDQRPYAQTHDLDEVLEELRRKRQRWLVWPKDPNDLSQGHELVDVTKLAKILKIEEERRYTLAVAYPANEIDAHGDYMTPEELEEAAWNYLRKSRKIGLMHKDGTEGAGEVVESYIYRGPPWEVNGERVEPGDWLLGIIWTPEAWERIKKGEFTGLSLQGWGRKVD